MMKQYLLKSMLFIITLLLVGCVYHQRPSLSTDMVDESWMRQVETNSAKWRAGASNWFLYGDNVNVAVDQQAPARIAISTMMVKVPDYLTNVTVNGCFQVQLFGTSGHNSLYLYGSNAAVRGVDVKITGNTLYLTQTKDAPADMRNVIIRIGVRNLNNLTQLGSGRIEARTICSNHLCLYSSGCGPVYLAGVNVNLAQVTSAGKGNITVFGAITPKLAVFMSSSGSVNICGNVGIYCVTHHGCGDLNIIGANTDRLKIVADGKGKIGIHGRVAIDQIDAKDAIAIYAYYVNGGTLRVSAKDYARVGLAGCMRNLYVDAGGNTRFSGHYLYTNDAYVRAYDAAHINVTAANNLFASAIQNSSIYYFRSPNTLSQFYRGNGVIIPLAVGRLPSRNCGYCPYYRQTRIYKD